MNRLGRSPTPAVARLVHPPRLRPSRRGALASAILACAIAVVLGTTPAMAARKAPQPDSDDLKELRSRIDSLRNDIQEKEESRNEARDALRESERAISEANRRLHDLSGERAQTREDLGKLNDEAGRLEAEVAARKDAIAHLVRERYYGGEADYFKLLLSGQDPNQTARDLHYYSYVSRAQAAQLDTLRTKLARLHELETESHGKTGELDDIQAEQTRERDRLASEENARRQVLDRVSAEIRDQKKRMQGMERDENRLTRLIEGLDKVIAAKPARIRGPEPKSKKQAVRTAAAEPEPRSVLKGEESASAVGGQVTVAAEGQASQADDASDGTPAAGAQLTGLKGGLRFPVRGELAAHFGSPRVGGGPTWKGLFIRAPAGQEVRAVAAGRVVFADWMRGFGNMLILDHGEGYLSIYGNTQAVLRQVGDVVRAGEAVATTGSSGGNTDSGLYFEIRHEGRPFDPLKWLSLK